MAKHRAFPARVWWALMTGALLLIVSALGWLSAYHGGAPTASGVGPPTTTELPQLGPRR